MGLGLRGICSGKPTEFFSLGLSQHPEKFCSTARFNSGQYTLNHVRDPSYDIFLT